MGHEVLRSGRTLVTAQVAVVLLLTSCSATGPVASAPTPASIQGYLDRHPHAALRIADSVGRSQWIYEAELRGDTLHGLRTSTRPRDSIAVAVIQITEVAAPRFSTTRTLGIVGGVAAVVGIWALIAPQPVY